MEPKGPHLGRGLPQSGSLRELPTHGLGSVDGLTRAGFVSDGMADLPTDLVKQPGSCQPAQSHSAATRFGGGTTTRRRARFASEVCTGPGSRCRLRVPD